MKPQLIYDGICNLCISAIRLLYALDRKHHVEFVPYQELRAATRRHYALTGDLLQGRMHLITREGRLVSGPLAIREVCGMIFPFHFICSVFVIPESQRVYDWIARHRYWIFGCRDTCYVIKQGSNW